MGGSQKKNARFIDGDHSYDALVEDLRLWSPKVRFGGCCLVSVADLRGGFRAMLYEFRGRVMLPKGYAPRACDIICTSYILYINRIYRICMIHM